MDVETSFHSALSWVKDSIAFVVHRVTSPFYPNATFSSVCLDLAVHTIGVRKVALSLDTLFEVNIQQPYSEALMFIRDSNNQFWPVAEPKSTIKLTEQEVMLQICAQILVPLSKEVI